MADLSSLPGGETLAAMARQVDGKPGDIRGIAAKWRGVAGDVHDYEEPVTRAVRTVDAAWQGKSAQAFVTYMKTYDEAAGNLRTALAACAGALEKVATALEEAKPAIDGICARVVADARAEATRLQGKKEDEIRQALAGIVGQGVKDAQPELDKVVGAVRDAKTTLEHTLGAGYRDGGRTFAAIKEVAEQEFVPSPGRTIDWRRDPGYEAGPKTTYASYRPTSLSGVNSGAGAGTAGYGPSGPPPPGGGPAPTGQVKAWIEQAIEILTAQGYPAGKMNPNDIWMIIQHESGGNPHAINNWDSNAAAGTPSKGLMQTIDPTFNRWALPGHKDIWNPVDNIIAGVRYAIERYGSVSAVPGVVGMKTGTGYRGY